MIHNVCLPQDLHCIGAQKWVKLVKLEISRVSKGTRLKGSQDILLQYFEETVMPEFQLLSNHWWGRSTLDTFGSFEFSFIIHPFSSRGVFSTWRGLQARVYFVRFSKLEVTYSIE